MSYDNSGKSTNRQENPNYSGKKLGPSYSITPKLDREETAWLVKNILFKSKAPQEYGFCVKDSRFVKFDLGVPFDYQHVPHNTKECEVIHISGADLMNLKPKMKEIGETVSKLRTHLAEAQRMANLTEEERDQEIKRRRHRRGHIDEGIQHIQIQESDQADRIE